MEVGMFRELAGLGVASELMSVGMLKEAAGF